MDWVKIKEEILYKDGSLRDIYFQGMTEKTRAKFWEFMKYNALSKELILDNKTFTEFPSFPEIKKQENKLLKIRLDGILVVCHFFTDEEIEMDIDPGEVKNIELWNKLINMLTDLSRFIGVKGKITPESAPEYILMEIE